MITIFFFNLAVFILITYSWVSILESISSTKIINNTEEAPFGIPGVSTEPENNLGVNLIVESKISFLLEIYWCSCE